MRQRVELEKEREKVWEENIREFLVGREGIRMKYEARSEKYIWIEIIGWK